MLKSSIAFAITLCALACATNDKSDTIQTAASSTVSQSQSTLPTPSAATTDNDTTAVTMQDTAILNGADLTCVPGTLRANDTLTLRMETPHGDYLTATQPDKTLFFIVYPRFDDPSRKFSLMPSEEFKTTASLRLPATFRAKPWIYGRDSTETFFSRPGKYVLWVGENLESDINRHAVKCEVVFQP